MISIKSLLTRGAVYWVGILFLITIIVMGIGFTFQLNAADDDDLPDPLPYIITQACTSSVHANVYVEPAVANWSYVGIEDHGLKFTGEASGYTEDQEIASVIFIENENGQTVPKDVPFQKIWIQIVFGDENETKGLSFQEVIGIYEERGESIPAAKVIGLPAGLDDWFSPRSRSTAHCSGNLGSHTDSATANYYSFMIFGFRVCRGTGISSS